MSDCESEPAGPRNIFLRAAKNLTLRGFRGSANFDLLKERRQGLAAWLREGTTIHREIAYDGPKTRRPA